MPHDLPVTVVGEALIDVIVQPSGRIEDHVGGSPTNVAIGLARLDHRVRLATHIGSDERGRRIAGLMSSEGVELIAGSTTSTKTATAVARLDTAGVPTYEFDFEWQLDATSVQVPPGGHLHIGSIGATVLPGREAVRNIVRASRAESTVSYDPNCRPGLMGTRESVRPVIEQLIGLSDVVKASAEDVQWLYPEMPIASALAHWAAIGPSLCAITQGSGELLLLTQGRLRGFRPLPATVADTIGAGDSFMAGLISALLDDGLLGGNAARERLLNIEEAQIARAVQRALSCAAVTVSRAGANPPRHAEITDVPIP